MMKETLNARAGGTDLEIREVHFEITRIENTRNLNRSFDWPHVCIGPSNRR